MRPTSAVCRPPSLAVAAPALLAPALWLALATLPLPLQAQSPVDKVNNAAKQLQSIFKKGRKKPAPNRYSAGGGAGATGARGATGANGAPAGADASAPEAAASGRSAASAPVSAGSAKVEESIVAPNEQDMTYIITPTGSHVASIVQKGSRWAVMYDGVMGPAFDKIQRNGDGTTIAFSPDGSRFAYAARSGTEWVVMVDGKEMRRGPIGNNITMANGGGLAVRFSPNGKHVVFYYANPTNPDPRVNGDRYYWDNVPGPVGATSNLTVSPDGERHAYIVQPPGTNEQVLAVDGKLMPGLGGDPQFTSDGKHLFTRRAAPPVGGRPVTEVLLDGRPFMRAEQVAVHVPPVGDRVVTVVGRGNPQGGATMYQLVVGGQRVPGTETDGFAQVHFSPDGRRYAAITGNVGPRKRVFIDGKPGQDYDGIDSLWFSPDSKHVAYTAHTGSRLFVVLDGVESDVPFMLLPKLAVRFTPTGRSGWMSQTEQGAAVVVDGKVTRLPRSLPGSDFSFSPDGAHFAYFLAAEPSGLIGGTVAIDHAPGPPSMLRDFAQYRSGDPVKFIWSPDGKYTVNYGAPGTKGWAGEFGFVIGDRYLSQGNLARVVFPTFTPDAKHFFWLMEDGAHSAMKIFLDGKPVYEFDAQGHEPLKAKGAWEMGENGVLSFIIQTVDGFKRVRITPGPENGFEQWLATGKALK